MGTFSLLQGIFLTQESSQGLLHCRQILYQLSYQGITSKYPKSFLDKLNSVTAKRPKTVIQHILEHGFVTTEELEQLYGYKHAPRAARDVRELGIPLETYRVKSSDGRSIGAYRFGNPALAENAVSKTAGRTALSKALKKALIEKFGSKCFIYL